MTSKIEAGMSGARRTFGLTPPKAHPMTDPTIRERLREAEIIRIAALLDPAMQGGYVAEMPNNIIAARLYDAGLRLIEGSDPADGSWEAYKDAFPAGKNVIEGSDPASPEAALDVERFGEAILAAFRSRSGVRNRRSREMNYRDLLLEFIAWCVDNPPEAIFEDGEAAKDAVDAFLKATDPRDESERAFDAAYWPEPG